MPSSSVALQVLFILLPGLAASAIVRALANRSKQSDFGQVVEAALLSLVIYAGYVLARKGELPFSMVRPIPTSSDFVVVWSRTNALVVAALTLGVALISTLYINKDFNRLLRSIHLTERTTRQSVWSDVFQSVAAQQQIVQVELEGERSVRGVLSYYSDDAEDASLYLRQASWVSADGEVIPIQGGGILLTKAATIKSVSLLDAPRQGS